MDETEENTPLAELILTRPPDMNVPTPDESASDAMTHNQRAVTQLAPKANERIFLKSFNPDDGPRIETWFQYYDNQCQLHHLDDTWKKNNLPNFMNYSAFDFTVRAMKNDISYDELKELMILRYTDLEKNLYTKFNELTLHEGDNLREFYFKKLEFAERLQLPDKLLIENLLHSTPPAFRNLMIISGVSSGKEWYRKLNEIWDENKPQLQHSAYNNNLSSETSAKFALGVEPHRGRGQQTLGAEAGGDRQRQPWKPDTSHNYSRQYAEQRRSRYEPEGPIARPPQWKSDTPRDNAHRRVQNTGRQNYRTQEI